MINIPAYVVRVLFFSGTELQISSIDLKLNDQIMASFSHQKGELKNLLNNVLLLSSMNQTYAVRT